MQESIYAYKVMSCLICVALKVQVVYHILIASLFDCSQHDLHIELTPTLLGDAEWRLSNDCTDETLDQ